MHHSILDKNNEKEITNLFTSAFTSSEGVEEGRLIGRLVSALASETDDRQIICLGTYEDNILIGAIFFTRLRFNEPIKVYMLAPVAVGTGHQGKGLGQALITYGLDELKNRSVAVVITYGDPAFYTKVGFQSLSETVIQAPLQLSMPEGWLGQSLTGDPIPTIRDRPVCVDPFNDPVYW